MDSNQNIVFLTPGFPSSEQDSVTIPALQIFLKALRKKIPLTQLTIISFQYPKTDIPYKWFDCDVLPLGGNNIKLKKPWIWRKAKKRLQQLNKKQKITQIHSFWIGDCSYIAHKFSTKNKIPFIITAMGQESKSNSLYTRYFRLQKPTIITLSKNHYNDILEAHNIKSKIIPWALNIEEFPCLNKNTIDIIGVGSLNTVKNFSLFISIIFAIREKLPNLKVSIIGEGKQLKLLRKSVKKLKLEDTITFLGLLTRKEVLNKMSSSNVLLHTSKYESYGYVFSEALYSGMKIVSFDVGFSETSKDWIIGINKDELINSCLYFLSNTSEKKRVHIHKMNYTINEYLKLYNLPITLND